MANKKAGVSKKIKTPKTIAPNAPESKEKQINSNYRGIVFQVIGFTMMTLGFMLIILPLAINLFKNEEKNPYTQEANFSTETDDDEQKGNVDIDGVSTFRVDAGTLSAKEKSDSNIARIRATGKWTATDYAPGDVGVGNYEVRQGDTLWEISEAVYGDGDLWGNILSRNSDQVGFLPNGQQALIFPGQVLVIAR